MYFFFFSKTFFLPAQRSTHIVAFGMSRKNNRGEAPLTLSFDVLVSLRANLAPIHCRLQSLKSIGGSEERVIPFKVEKFATEEAPAEAEAGAAPEDGGARGSVASVGQQHPAPRVVTGPLSDRDTESELDPRDLSTGYVDVDPIQAAVLRCACEDVSTRPVVSGPGEHSRRLAGTVKHCPVHFPFGWHSDFKPPPRAPAAKSFAVSGVSRGVDQLVGAVSGCDEDAGYVLYQTEARSSVLFVHS